jgi:hypothetical protein
MVHWYGRTYRGKVISVQFDMKYPGSGRAWLCCVSFHVCAYLDGQLRRRLKPIRTIQRLVHSCSRHLLTLPWDGPAHPVPRAAPCPDVSAIVSLPFYMLSRVSNLCSFRLCLCFRH